jgi:hypothetical protein
MTQVDSLAALTRLRRQPDRFRRQITLLIPELGTEKTQAADLRIRAYQRDCGCSAGAASLFIAMAVSTAFIGIHYGWMSWAFVVRLPFVLLISFIAGGVGKILALALARRRFDRELDLLIRTFA